MPRGGSPSRTMRTKISGFCVREYSRIESAASPSESLPWQRAHSTARNVSHAATMGTSVEGECPSPALSPTGTATTRAATSAVTQGVPRRNPSALRVGDTSDKPPALIDHIHKDVTGWTVDEDALERIGWERLNQSGWPVLLSGANKPGSGVIGELPTVAAFVDQPERSAFRAVDRN